MTEDELLQKILKLTSELNLQQQTNQDMALDIKSQVNEWKRSSNNKTGRYIDNEYLLPELIPANIIDTTTSNNSNGINSDTLADVTSKHTRLLQEHVYFKSRNRELEQECKELQDLAQKYESSIDLIAGKLQTWAAITSEGQAQTQREYETSLDTEKDTTVALFMENVFLQSRLKKLLEIIRNSCELNTTVAIDDAQIQQLMIENEELRSMLAIPDQQHSSLPSTSSPIYNQATVAPGLPSTKLSSGVITEYFEGDNSSVSSISR